MRTKVIEEPSWMKVKRRGFVDSERKKKVTCCRSGWWGAETESEAVLTSRPVGTQTQYLWMFISGLVLREAHIFHSGTAGHQARCSPYISKWSGRVTDALKRSCCWSFSFDRLKFTSDVRFLCTVSPVYHHWAQTKHIPVSGDATGGTDTRARWRARGGSSKVGLQHIMCLHLVS